MGKRYEVDWYKECYPFPDECGKKVFGTREAAVAFSWKMSEAGYQTMLIVRAYNPDEED